MLRRLIAAPLTALLVLLVAPAYAWSPDVHRYLAEKALRPVVPPGMVLTPDDDQFVGFYLWVGQALAHRSEEKDRDGTDPDRFLKRYPHPRAFDAFAIRGFLGLSQEPTPAVWGLEEFQRNAGLDRFNLAVQGAAMPDLDQRNRNRLAYDSKRRLLKDDSGQPLPADPAVLGLGGSVTGPGSEAHAHRALDLETPCFNVICRESTPWQFAPGLGPAEGAPSFAEAMAQRHLDLAILARTWGDTEDNQVGEYLALMWWSAGLHYVQDAADPAANVPLGGPGLWARAESMRWQLAWRSVGGYVQPLPALLWLARQLSGSARWYADAWFARQLELLRMDKPAAAALAGAWTQTDVDDPELVAELGDQIKPHLTGAFQSQPFDDGAGAMLVRALARLGGRDGGRLVDAAATAMHPGLANGPLRAPGALLRPADSGDPDDPDVQQATGQMAIAQARALRRVATASRLYWQAFENGSSDAAARRLRRQCLNALDAQEARLQAYRKAPPPPQPLTEPMPVVLAAEVGAVLALLAGLWVWRRKRRT